MAAQEVYIVDQKPVKSEPYISCRCDAFIPRGAKGCRSQNICDLSLSVPNDAYLPGTRCYKNI